VGEALIVANSRRFDVDHFEEADGDSIWVDRTFAGLTPLEITVAPGTHGVRVRSVDGRDQVTRIVELPSGAIRVVRADFGGERRLSLSHVPPSDLVAGESIALTVRVHDDETPPAESMVCRYRVTGETFAEREMHRIDDASIRWALSIDGAETDGRLVEYWFSARDRDGVEIVSDIYRVPLAEMGERIAENS
jgi:hypothetical protein